MVINKVMDASSVIICNTKGEFLLQKKTFDYPWYPGMWCCFGGGVEPGESPRNAALREMQEEGIKIENIKSFKEESYRDECHLGSKIGKHYFFVAEFPGKIEEISINEGGGFAFFDIAELENMKDLIIPHDLRAIREFDRQRHR